MAWIVTTKTGINYLLTIPHWTEAALSFNVVLCEAKKFSI